MMPILEGLDGVEKMSKSLDNYIGITEKPEEIFGKVMSISDELMWRYYELLTDRSPAEVEALKSRVAAGEIHPMKAKAELGRQIVSDFHSPEAAEKAEAHFRQVFQRRENPDEMPEIRITSSAAGVPIIDIVLQAGFAASKGQARRLVQQGGVSLDGSKVADPFLEVGEGDYILRVGKRKFARVWLG